MKITPPPTPHRAPTAVGGDLSGSTATPVVSGLGGTPLDTTTPTTGDILVFDGTTWAPTAPGAGSSPLTTKGDIFGYSTVEDRIPVGTNGKVLTADSTVGLGVSWQTPSTGTVSYTNAASSANTSVPNTSTYTDVTGCSASLAAGTYLCWVTADCSTANAGAIFVHLKVTDGTNEYAVERYTLNGTGVSGEDTFSLVSLPIVLSGTTTVKLQAASNTAFTVLQKTGGLNTANTGSTRILFLKVA